MKTLSETRILIYILYIEWIVSHVKEGNKILWIVLISEFGVVVEIKSEHEDGLPLSHSSFLIRIFFFKILKSQNIILLGQLFKRKFFWFFFFTL